MKFYSFTEQNRSIEEANKIYDARIKDSKEVFNKFSSTFYSRECPYCGCKRKTQTDKFLKLYDVVRCDSCSSLYVDPVPSLEALSYYYNEGECNKIFMDLLRKRHKENNVTISSRSRKICSLIESYIEQSGKKEISLLEIGCGSGVFLSEMNEAIKALSIEAKVNLVGIDIDENAIQESVDENIELICISAESFVAKSAKKFDFAVHYELIEHLNDPFGFALAVNNLLVSGGLHFFTTPNINGFDNTAVDYTKTRLLAHSVFPPMHLNCFSPQNMSIFSIRAGFDIVEINTPGVFDVDITRLSLEEIDEDSPFKEIDKFSEEQLGIIQAWLQELNASSHMEVTLAKPA